MTELNYMEFSIFGDPITFRWPRNAATLNPLAITETVRPESADAYVLAKCAAQSARIAELGTQFGLYSVIMAHAMPAAGKLAGLEILPLNAQISNANLQSNRLAHKGLVLHAAASDADGYHPALIDIHRENASLLGDGGPIHGIGTTEVPQFSLDRLQNYFGAFEMVKIDVEGFEANIVPSSAFDDTGITIAAIEIHPHAMHDIFGKDPGEFLRRFHPDRYTGFALIGKDGRFTVHDLTDEGPILNALTANAFFFRRGVHDQLASNLRRKLEEMNEEQLAPAL